MSTSRSFWTPQGPTTPLLHNINNIALFLNPLKWRLKSLSGRKAHIQMNYFSQSKRRSGVHTHTGRFSFLPRLGGLRLLLLPILRTDQILNSQKNGKLKLQISWRLFICRSPMLLTATLSRALSVCFLCFACTFPVIFRKKSAPYRPGARSSSVPSMILTK